MRTTTIALRPFRTKDVDDFMEWAGNDRVTRYCRWNTFTSRAAALDFLKQVIDSHHGTEPYAFPIGRSDRYTSCPEKAKMNDEERSGML